LAVSFNKILFIASILVLTSCNSGEDVTFTGQIAPIIHQNCTPCHREGGGGPFSLVTYKDVAKRSKMVAHVTKIRYMPPWPADPHYTEFKNQRVLSADDINLIQKWHKSGAKEGDTSGFVINIDEQFRKEKSPDLIVKLQPVFIKGNHRDRFYVSKNPVFLPQDTFIKMIEFIPGLANIVHHVNGHLLNYPHSYPINIMQGRTIVDVESPDFDKEFQEMNLYTSGQTLPDRIHSAVNYLPGLRGVMYPEGIGGFKMNQKSVFVFKDLHYGPSDKDTTDISELHLYFSKTPPQRPVRETMLGTNGIAPIVPPLVIPANQIKTFRTSAFVGEGDISVLSLNPHMHLLGKSFIAYALKPNGDTIPLIHIPKWDFRWQYYYTFKKPVRIPKGSTIMVEATFDNTKDNPNNPNSPPIQVSERLDLGGASMRTTDEMLQFIITYLPYQSGDENLSLETDG
jgi:hypothetical protein